METPSNNNIVFESFTKNIMHTKLRKTKTFALTYGEILNHLTRDPKNFKIENLD